jgi:hypothetical protein
MLLTFTARQHMSTAERTYDYPTNGWRGPSRFMHPVWILAMILGFIFWWPVGLAILAFMIWNKNMSCHGGDRWQRKMERMEDKMGRMRDRMERWGGAWQGPPASGNHAFDEYRAETLRRLETSSASSATSLTGCASPRTRPNSTSSWLSGATVPPRRHQRLRSRRADSPRSRDCVRAVRRRGGRPDAFHRGNQILGGNEPLTTIGPVSTGPTSDRVALVWTSSRVIRG